MRSPSSPKRLPLEDAHAVAEELQPVIAAYALVSSLELRRRSHIGLD